LLPLRLRPSTHQTTSSMPSVPEPTTTNAKTSMLTVGSRVSVNGLKSGTLRYLGTVQFATGEFCGVELDQPEGKHDGEVQKIRYFHCAPNHGIFVPKDKVALESRLRTSSAQRPTISRLKPPSITRSVTLNSSINKIETSKIVQLPDIVPSSVPSSPVTMNNNVTTTVTQPSKNENVVISNEATKEMILHQAERTPAPIIVDEPSETIEADFTASVSLILHQLQQEQRQQEEISTRNSSIAISEEETDEDEDEEDDEDDEEEEDDDDVETKEPASIVIQSVREDVPIPIIDRSKSIQTELSFHVQDTISFTKIDPNQKLKPTNKNHSDNKTANPPGKKNIERRPVVPPAKLTKPTNLRKPLVPTAKKPVPSKTQLNPSQSVVSLPSQSILHSTRSSLNSLNSSQSDLNSTLKMTESQLSPIHDLEKQLEVSEQNLTALQDQLQTQKHLHQSLQTHHQQITQQYHHVLNRFDLLHILTQYLSSQNDRQNEEKLAAQHKCQRLIKQIEQLKSTHQNDLIRQTAEHQQRFETFERIHQDQIKEFHLKIQTIEDEKCLLESRCQILQEKVDSFLNEMANSEHADVLLCHVEHLEKDRTSLQTVLEMKTFEVNQLRTKLNEQTVQLEDKMALQKRIDMAENRNQDLTYLLRQRQLQEKAAMVERDQLKEQYIQLEREHRQLKFENETLLYRLRQRSISPPAPVPSLIIESPLNIVPSRFRSRSFSSTSISEQMNELSHRCLSFDSLYFR